MTNRRLLALCLVGLAGACAPKANPHRTNAEPPAAADTPQGGHDEHGEPRESNDHGEQRELDEHLEQDDRDQHDEHTADPALDPSRHHPAHGMQHDFSNVARFEAVFDAPERAAWQRPVEVVRLLRVTSGQTVVDLGTGTGYFLPYLSVAVGPDGHVVALDSERAMVEHVRRRARREGLANVEARTVPADDVALAPGSVDRILVVDTWHHLPHRARYSARLREALRPGGEILVVDFTLESAQGPSVEHRLAPERVAAELASAGLDVEVVNDEGLPDQYVVRATKR